MQQIMLASAVLGVVAAMTFLMRGVMQEPMALLYSGVESARAGEIVEELERQNIPYEMNGESIFVPESRRDSVRVALAREGIPRQSVQGYELLDNVNGFSVTSEMYNAAYWRAKEGELTRTILAIPGVDSARVHIGASLRSGFSRQQAAQTASVTVSTSRALNPGQAESVQYLVALAVSGLNPDDVAVIDTTRGILAGPSVHKAEQPAIIADTQAGLVEQKIMRLLDARVGAGNARVSVSVDINRNRERVSEVTFDPQSRVIRARTTNDSSETSTGGGGAGVTVASNLPTGEGVGGGGGSTIKNSVENVTYELNEVRREKETLPGEIERISIAVLLNEQVFNVDATTATGASEIQEIISEFEQLITTGAGLDVGRGDAITVELMPFQEIETPELVAAPSMFEELVRRYFWTGLQALLLGLVVIALGLGVVRPILTQGPGQAASRPGQPELIGSSGETGLQEAGADPFEYLKGYTSEREDDAAALLQEWLTDEAEDDGAMPNFGSDVRMAVNE